MFCDCVAELSLAEDSGNNRDQHNPMGKVTSVGEGIISTSGQPQFSVHNPNAKNDSKHTHGDHREQLCRLYVAANSRHNSAGSHRTTAVCQISSCSYQ